MLLSHTVIVRGLTISFLRGVGGGGGGGLVGSGGGVEGLVSAGLPLTSPLILNQTDIFTSQKMVHGIEIIEHEYFTLALTLEGIRGGCQSDPPSIFLVLNFYSLTDYQKLWHNCSLFVKTSFDPN